MEDMFKLKYMLRDLKDIRVEPQNFFSPYLDYIVLPTMRIRNCSPNTVYSDVIYYKDEEIARVDYFTQMKKIKVESIYGDKFTNADGAFDMINRIIQIEESGGFVSLDEIEDLLEKPICLQSHINELKRNWNELIANLNKFQIVLMIISICLGLIALMI